MREKKPIKWLVALHESGHAAVALSLGLGIREVTIVPTLMTHGSCTPLQRPPSPDDQLLLAVAGDVCVETFQKGGAAKLRAAIKAGEAETLRSCRNVFADVGLEFDPARDVVHSDGKAIEGALRAAKEGGTGGKTTDQQRVLAASRAVKELIYGNRRRVEKLAEELMIVGTVDGVRATELLSAD